MRATRAFACASDCAALRPLVREETVERLNNPTAMTVSRIISESVTTRAKPLELGLEGIFTAEKDRDLTRIGVITSHTKM